MDCRRQRLEAHLWGARDRALPSTPDAAASVLADAYLDLCAKSQGVCVSVQERTELAAAVAADREFRGAFWIAAQSRYFLEEFVLQLLAIACALLAHHAPRGHRPERAIAPSELYKELRAAGKWPEWLAPGRPEGAFDSHKDEVWAELGVAPSPKPKGPFEGLSPI